MNGHGYLYGLGGQHRMVYYSQVTHGVRDQIVPVLGSSFLGIGLTYVLAAAIGFSVLLSLAAWVRRG